MGVLIWQYGILSSKTQPITILSMLSVNLYTLAPPPTSKRHVSGATKRTITFVSSCYYGISRQSSSRKFSRSMKFILYVLSDSLHAGSLCVGLLEIKSGFLSSKRNIKKKIFLRVISSQQISGKNSENK